MKKRNNNIITVDRVLTLDQLNTISSALNNQIIEIREIKEDYQEWYISLLETERSINELCGIYRNIKNYDNYKLLIEIVES